MNKKNSVCQISNGSDYDVAPLMSSCPRTCIWHEYDALWVLWQVPDRLHDFSSSVCDCMIIGWWDNPAPVQLSLSVYRFSGEALSLCRTSIPPPPVYFLLSLRGEITAWWNLTPHIQTSFIRPSCSVGLRIHSIRFIHRLEIGACLLTLSPFLFLYRRRLNYSPFYYLMSRQTHLTPGADR